MILLADDDPEIIDLISDLLSQLGWPYRSFPDGAMLVDYAREAAEPVEVVLLDYQMPRLNGFDTLVELRRIPGLVHTPVLFFSADTSEERVIQGLDFGAEDYITKPFRIREFRSRLEKARKRYGTEQALRPEFGCLSGQGMAAHWLGWPAVYFFGLSCAEWDHFRSKLPEGLTAGQWLAQMLRIPGRETWLVWLSTGCFGIIVPQLDTDGRELLEEISARIRRATADLFSPVEREQGYTYVPRPGGQGEMVGLDIWAWTACAVKDPAEVEWLEMERFCFAVSK